MAKEILGNEHEKRAGSSSESASEVGLCSRNPERRPKKQVLPRFCALSQLER